MLRFILNFTLYVFNFTFYICYIWLRLLHAVCSAHAKNTIKFVSCAEQFLFPFQATTSRHFKSYASGKHAQCSATDETNFQILGLFTGKDGW